MTPDIAKAAIVFLSRADLKGNEAPILMQVVQALEAFANPQPPPAAPAVTEPAPASAIVTAPLSADNA